MASLEGRTISDISTRVLSFIRTYIRSVWQLELLLFMRTSQRSLTGAEIEDALYMDGSAISGALSFFEKNGLVKRSAVQPDAFVYNPSSNELRDTVEEIAQVYGQRRVAVIKLIMSCCYET